jgi:hypothetical protein
MYQIDAFLGQLGNLVFDCIEGGAEFIYRSRLKFK